MGHQECSNCGESVNLISPRRDTHDPDLLYEVRRLYGLIQEFKIESQNPIRNRWMRTSDAAKYANVSTKQIRRAVKAGLLKCGKRAGQWRFKREWIDKYIMNN